MADKEKTKIVVVGDVTLDWIEESTPRLVAGGGTQHNYQLRPGFRWTPVWGGAALVERLLDRAIKTKYEEEKAKELFELDGVKEHLPPETEGAKQNYLQSLAVVKQMVNDEGKPIRVDLFKGFFPGGSPKLAVAPCPVNISPLGCLVVDDAANGCRNDPDFVRSLTQLSTHAPLVIVKLSRPLDKSVLMSALVARPAPGRRMVIVVNADDLRAQSVDISRRLSWEHSASDLLSSADESEILQLLSGVGDLLVRFGNDGCVLLQRDGARQLVFDPRRAEDAFDQKLSGTMPGATSAFVAEVAASLLHGDNLLDSAIKGLCASRRLLQCGFQRNSDAEPLDYPLNVFGEKDSLQTDFIPVELPKENYRDWNILSTKLTEDPLDLAKKIVREGHEEHLKDVPVASFGKLLLVDRREIEGYRSIENLLREYIRSRDGGKRRPLSIGVFGPPGSGKSFGIKEIANEISNEMKGTRITFWPYNLTQFAGPDDLIGAFHTARDEALRGNLPLLIFDEFDCRFEDPWGWLKFFLAPMQDGEFKDNRQIHPLGHAIFVFAGGIAESFKKFSEPDDNTSKSQFEKAKGPDFASRLKGYVNVVGINPPLEVGTGSKPKYGKVDGICMVRRAILLRSLLLEQGHRTRNMNPITNRKSRFDIDDAVLEALLKVDSYHYGARSLESILVMSRLTERDHFGVAALPSDAQLKIHVDDSFVENLKRQA